MSEIENNQETNGTSNGEVPEIELIIKEKFMLESRIVENVTEDNINKGSAAESSTQIDEKENIIQAPLQQQRQHKHQQQPEETKWYKAVHTAKTSPQRKDILGNANNEATEKGHVLMLTRHDNQHFHFEYVTHKQEDNALETSQIIQPIADHSITLDHKLSINHEHRVRRLEKRAAEKVMTETEQSSSLDFAAMVAEACEGLFEEIENDLRCCDTDGNIYIAHEAEPIVGAASCSTAMKRKKRAHNSEAVRLAANAVLEGRMSLGEAAKRYNVVRSTVWSRVAKHPKVRRRKSNSQLDELIHNKLIAGIQISEISRLLHVPKSTVHMHKTRLKNSGMLPSVWIRNGSKDMVDHGVQERLMRAYRGHIVNGMSVRFAAEFFSLPLTTLWRYIKRRKSAIVRDNDVNSANGSTVKNSDEVDEENVDRGATVYHMEVMDDVEENTMVTEIDLSCPSAKCSVTLEMNIEKQTELLEQTLINQLLE